MIQQTVLVRSIAFENTSNNHAGNCFVNSSTQQLQQSTIEVLYKLGCFGKKRKILYSRQNWLEVQHLKLHYFVNCSTQQLQQSTIEFLNKLGCFGNNENYDNVQNNNISIYLKKAQGKLFYQLPKTRSIEVLNKLGCFCKKVKIMT